jgi:hypothetical protein
MSTFAIELPRPRLSQTDALGLALFAAITTLALSRPSLHGFLPLLAAALLIWNSTRGWRRWPAGIFAVPTAASTLATGEHYRPDLIAALTWTWTLDRLARRMG